MSDSETSETTAESLADTSNRLRSTLGRSNGEGGSEEPKGDEGDGLDVLPTDAIGDDPEESGNEAESALEGLAGGSETEEGGSTTTGDRIGEIGQLLRVINAAKNLLSTIDLSALVEAIDISELPSAIETSEIPTAIRERDPKKAIQYRKLLNVIDFRTLLGSAEIRELRKEKGEFEDAFEDLTGGSIGGDDDDGDGDESGLGSEIMDDLGDGMGAMSALAGEDEAIPSDLMQDQIQSQIDDAVEGFRDSALEARDSLKGMRDKTKEEVEEKTGGNVGQPSSLNPTAYSTMQSFDSRVDMHNTAKFSTIPRTAWHSTASGRDRMYGSRFENEEESEEENQ